MKKQFLISLLISAIPLGMFAQNDDMYFTPKKTDRKAEAKKEVTTERPVYYVGSDREVDEYNRRGQFRSNYQKLLGDSIANDIIDFDMTQGVYPDSTYEAPQTVYGEPYQFDDFDDDYTYSRQLYRFDGFYDPWFYGWYGHSPYWYSRPYGAYYSWYDPWYGPWYGGYYGWYDPWYSPWYGGYYGWGWPYSAWHGYYGGWYGGWGYAHGGGYIRQSPTHRSNFGGTNGARGRSSWASTNGGHSTNFGTSASRRSSATGSRSSSSSASQRPRSSFSNSANSSFGSTNSSSTRSYSPSSSSSGSFGGSRGGGFSGGGGGGGARSGGGGSFGGHR